MTTLTHNRIGNIRLNPLYTEDYPATGLRLRSAYQAKVFQGDISLQEFVSLEGPVFDYAYALPHDLELKKSDDCEGLKMLLVFDGKLVLKDALGEPCVLAPGKLCVFEAKEYLIQLPNNPVRYLLCPIDKLLAKYQLVGFKAGRYHVTASMHTTVGELKQTPLHLGYPEQWLSHALGALVLDLGERIESGNHAQNWKSYRLDYVLAADAYIQRNLTIDLTTIQIARAVGLNECQLKTAFGEWFKMGMHSRQNFLRVELAKRLLKETDTSVTEVGYICGFNDDGTYRKNFRKLTGMLPSDWRIKYRL